MQSVEISGLKEIQKKLEKEEDPQKRVELLAQQMASKKQLRGRKRRRRTRRMW